MNCYRYNRKLFINNTFKKNLIPLITFHFFIESKYFLIVVKRGREAILNNDAIEYHFCGTIKGIELTSHMYISPHSQIPFVIIKKKLRSITNYKA